MEEEFVTYEIALKLKEIGFDEISRFGMETSLYNEDGDHTFYANYGFMGSGLSKQYTKAPLWQQAINYIRDEKGLHIELPIKRHKDSGYKVQIKQYNKDNRLCCAVGYFEASTYVKAREEGILKAIEKIKKLK